MAYNGVYGIYQFFLLFPEPSRGVVAGGSVSLCELHTPIRLYPTCLIFFRPRTGRRARRELHSPWFPENLTI